MKIQSKTNLIFTHKMIKAFADSMIKVFMPLIIYKASNNMLFAIIYLCAFEPLCALLNLVLKKVLQKYGVITIIIHFIPLIIVQFLLNLKMTWWLCLIFALLMSLAEVLYYVPLNLLFSFTDRKVNVAKFQIATNVGKLVFIVLTGFILGSNFTNSLLIVTITCSVLYLLSSIPILFGYGVLKKSYNKAVKHSRVVNTKSYKLFNLYHIEFGIFQVILEVILPLYLYINNLTFQSVAIVMALIEVCKIGANILAKFLVNKKLSFLSVIISISAMTISFAGMLISTNPLLLYIFSCCLGVSFPLLFVPMFSSFIKKIVKDHNHFDGMTYREAYIFSCRGFLYVPYFVIPSFTAQFILGFVCAGCIGFTSYKILNDKKNKKQTIEVIPQKINE